MLITKRQIKILSSFLLLTGLTSCSQSIYKDIMPAFKLAIMGKEDVKITRELINSIPYATIAAKLGKGQKSVLVLGLVNNDSLGWYSSDKNVLITKNGRIVKTEGFPRNILKTVFLDQDPILSHNYGQPLPKTSKRMVDFKDTDDYGIIIDSQYEILGRGKITIIDTSYDTYVIKETCNAKDLDWEFENFFWKDVKTGFVWKSIQSFEPNSPKIEIEILRPYNNS